MVDASRRAYPALDITFQTRTTAQEAVGLLAALLDDYSPTAVTESFDAADADSAGVMHTWRVFFPTAEMRDSAQDGLAATTWPLTTSKVDVEDEGWAERSQASLNAVTVDRIIVAPPWDMPEADTLPAGTHVIVIEPSMGFGTGHHQSTRLVLNAMQQTPFDGTRVLDLGTGSGVLAIAAAQLGARSVLAIDEDVDAVEAARKNVAINDAGPAVDVRQQTLETLELQQADIVLANLTGGLLARFAEGIMAQIAPGGRAILSGFTREELATVTHAFAPLTILREDEEDSWISLTLEKAGLRH